MRQVGSFFFHGVLGISLQVIEDSLQGYQAGLSVLLLTYGAEVVSLLLPYAALLQNPPKS